MITYNLHLREQSAAARKQFREISEFFDAFDQFNPNKLLDLIEANRAELYSEAQNVMLVALASPPEPKKRGRKPTKTKKAVDLPIETLYSRSTKDKIKAGLIKYYFEQRPAWSAFYVDIKSKLGLKDADKRLHERDPRNWILDGSEPEIDKLDLYAAFIREVYPNFDLSHTENAVYVSIGLALSELTIGKTKALDKDLIARARKLHGSFFLASEKTKTNSLHSLMVYTHVPNTPFLAVFFVNISHDAVAESSEKFFQNLDEMMAGIHLDEAKKLISFKTAIFCPTENEEKLYISVSKSDKGLPTHMMLKQNDDGTINFVKIDSDEALAIQEEYVPCKKLNHIHMVLCSEIGSES